MVRTSLNLLMAELAVGIDALMNLARANIESLAPLLNISDINISTHIMNVETRDEQIRVLGDKLEGLIVRILSLQAPVGRDLRKVISSFRIIYDLERISRDSLHACKFFANSLQVDLSDFLSSLFKDVEVTLDSLRGIMDSFASVYSNDNFLETEVPSLTKINSAFDEQIDELFERKIAEIHIMSDEGLLNAESAHFLLFALRAYERVGDHACNLLERAVYIQTGYRIRVD